MILVHESEYDVINESDAKPVYSRSHPGKHEFNVEKVEKYKCESGIT